VKLQFEQSPEGQHHNVLIKLLELKMGDCVDFFKDPSNRGHERVAWIRHGVRHLSHIGRGG
jgi:hypothetical protein